MSNKNKFEEKHEENDKRYKKVKKEVEYYQDILSTEECVENALKDNKAGKVFTATRRSSKPQ